MVRRNICCQPSGRNREASTSKPLCTDVSPAPNPASLPILRGRSGIEACDKATIIEERGGFTDQKVLLRASSSAAVAPPAAACGVARRADIRVAPAATARRRAGGSTLQSGWHVKAEPLLPLLVRGMRTTLQPVRRNAVDGD